MAFIWSDQSVARRLGFSGDYLLDASAANAGVVYSLACFFHAGFARMGDGVSNFWPSDWIYPKLDRSGEVVAGRDRIIGSIVRGVDGDRGNDCMAKEASLIGKYNDAEVTLE